MTTSELSSFFVLVKEMRRHQRNILAYPAGSEKRRDAIRLAKTIEAQVDRKLAEIRNGVQIDLKM